MGRSLGSPLDGHAALKDLSRIVSEMSNMKAMMREMARSARLRQQEDIIARNQRAREQVKHEFVMRNVAKQIDEQREYLASQASKRHEQRQANWRKEQLKEADAKTALYLPSSFFCRSVCMRQYWGGLTWPGW